MKLSEWARKQEISYKTAWEWFKEGKLHVPAYQTPTGTILVKVSEEKEGGKTAIYARVSSADQRMDLDRQVARLLEFANSQGMAVTKMVTEIGFRVERAQKETHASIAQGRKIIVMEPGKIIKDDLVQDMIEVLTSFCARLYGRRSARNRAKKAMEVIENVGK